VCYLIGHQSRKKPRVTELHTRGACQRRLAVQSLLKRCHNGLRPGMGPSPDQVGPFTSNLYLTSAPYVVPHLSFALPAAFACSVSAMLCPNPPRVCFRSSFCWKVRSAWRLPGSSFQTNRSSKPCRTAVMHVLNYPDSSR